MEHKRAIDFILGTLEKSLPSNLRYHSVEHTLAVMNSVEGLGREHQLSSTEMQLLQTAAAYHDSGFLQSYKEHEMHSCRIVEEKLPQFGFNDDQIMAIKGMIMSTKIPQNPQNLLEEILCDADLDYLGGDKYNEISQTLYDELGLNGVALSDNKWLDLQIQFLEDHNFWTNHAVEKYSSNKADVLNRLRSRRKLITRD